MLCCKWAHQVGYGGWPESPFRQELFVPLVKAANDASLPDNETLAKFAFLIGGTVQGFDQGGDYACETRFGALCKRARLSWHTGMSDE